MIIFDDEDDENDEGDEDDEDEKMDVWVKIGGLSKIYLDLVLVLKMK